jgi:hypothetical protein
MTLPHACSLTSVALTLGDRVPRWLAHLWLSLRGWSDFLGRGQGCHYTAHHAQDKPQQRIGFPKCLQSQGWDTAGQHVLFCYSEDKIPSLQRVTFRKAWTPKAPEKDIWAWPPSTKNLRDTLVHNPGTLLRVTICPLAHMGKPPGAPPPSPAALQISLLPCPDLSLGVPPSPAFLALPSCPLSGSCTPQTRSREAKTLSPQAGRAAVPAQWNKHLGVHTRVHAHINQGIRKKLSFADIYCLDWLCVCVCVCVCVWFIYKCI